MYTYISCLPPPPQYIDAMDTNGTMPCIKSAWEPVLSRLGEFGQYRAS